MTKLEWRRANGEGVARLEAGKVTVFVSRASLFFRHSRFGFRHFPTHDAGTVPND